MSFVIAGLIYGGTAGVSPGPLLALLIRDTLKIDFRSGARVAVAPLFTDLPIVAGTILLVSRVSEISLLPGILSLSGAIFLLYLGYETLQGGKENPSEDSDSDARTAAKRKTMRRAIVVNLLSPHPYVFWFLVGAPATIRAYALGLDRAIAFVSGFYVALVGSKLAIGYLVSRSKQFIMGRTYRIILRLLGLALFVFAGILIRDGVLYLL